MGLVINLLIFFALLSLGFFVGSYTERNHFRLLEEREHEMQGCFVTQLKSFPGAIRGEQPPRLFIAEAVIATDYLKSFLARLRNIFGGEVRSYRSLLTRARREALLRIQEQAVGQGYNAICNVRFETADVGGNSTLKRVAMVAIIASGTAYQAASTPS